MTKNKMIVGLILAALLFSGLSCYLIFQYMSPTRGTVYMFNGDYAAGKQLTSDMLVPMQVDASIILAGRKENIASRFVTPIEYEDIVRSGDSLRMDVSEGMPLTTSMLSISGGSTVEMNMRSDTVAVTIEVDQYTGITNDLKAGARVNIYSSMGASVSLIQQNKRILEVFRSEDGTINAVSIEEDVDESIELIYAVNYGEIYLGLVDAAGYQSIEGEDPTYIPGYTEENISSDFLYDEKNVTDTEFEDPMESEEADQKETVFTP